MKHETCCDELMKHLCHDPLGGDGPVLRVVRGVAGRAAVVGRSAAPAEPHGAIVVVVGRRSARAAARAGRRW